MSSADDFQPKCSLYFLLSRVNYIHLVSWKIMQFLFLVFVVHHVTN